MTTLITKSLLLQPEASSCQKSPYPHHHSATQAHGQYFLQSWAKPPDRKPSFVVLSSNTVLNFSHWPKYTLSRAPKHRYRHHQLLEGWGLLWGGLEMEWRWSYSYTILGYWSRLGPCTCSKWKRCPDRQLCPECLSYQITSDDRS